jgi:hypothetical protein
MPLCAPCSLLCASAVQHICCIAAAGLLLQVDERYLPQLAAVLSSPQSVGIVGGRPGASLYFLGAQGSAVLYLDPHEVQEVSLQGAVPAGSCVAGLVLHTLQRVSLGLSIHS